MQENKEIIPVDIHSMIRVNHAGEKGAVQIYKGQLAVLGKRPVGQTLKSMLTHEEGHFEAFNSLVREQRVRPTVLSPLWFAGAYALGVVTACLGEKIALACTVAVEEVIDEHYEDQKCILEESQRDNLHQALYDTVESCQKDEVEHKNIALALGAEDAIGYLAVTRIIKTISRTAIWLSKRI